MAIFELIFLTLSGVFIISLITFIIILFICDNKFYIICDLYKKEFGSLPLGVRFCYNASPLSPVFHSIKLNFIISPLIYNRKYTGSENDDVMFMRTLPKNLTYMYKVAFYNGLLMALTFCTVCVMAYLYNNGYCL